MKKAIALGLMLSGIAGTALADPTLPNTPMPRSVTPPTQTPLPPTPPSAPVPLATAPLPPTTPPTPTPTPPTTPTEKQSFVATAGEYSLVAFNVNYGSSKDSGNFFNTTYHVKADPVNPIFLDSKLVSTLDLKHNGKQVVLLGSTTEANFIDKDSIKKMLEDKGLDTPSMVYYKNLLTDIENWDATRVSYSDVILDLAKFVVLPEENNRKLQQEKADKLQQESNEKLKKAETDSKQRLQQSMDTLTPQTPKK